MTADQLAAACGIPLARAEAWAPVLVPAMAEFGIWGTLREAAFLATCNHESAGFTRMRENTRYTALQLANTWPRRFSTTGQKGGLPNAQAVELAMREQLIANTVYANRMGNGAPESGDGWTFRGGACIQITGRDAYRRAGKALGMELEHRPELVEEPRVAALVSAWVFYEWGCLDPADHGDFDKVSDLINRGRHTAAIGDSIGWTDRLAKYELALAQLNAPGAVNIAGNPHLRQA